MDHEEEEEIQENDEGVFEFLTEGELGTLKAVLVFHCPECGQTVRFTARDEDSEGKVRCPCGESTVDLQGDGLRGAQRKLDEINRSVKDLEKTFKNFVARRCASRSWAMESSSRDAASGFTDRCTRKSAMCRMVARGKNGNNREPFRMR